MCRVVNLACTILMLIPLIHVLAKNTTEVGNQLQFYSSLIKRKYHGIFILSLSDAGQDTNPNAMLKNQDLVNAGEWGELRLLDPGASLCRVHYKHYLFKSHW